MRYMDQASLDALNGSRPADTITVYVWYAGQLAYPDPLPVSDWSFSWDSTRQVQTASIDIKDPDGGLAPWLLEDPLGVGGSRLQVIYNVGGAGSLNLGWYRITAPVPVEQWHSYIVDDSGAVNTDTAVPTGKRQIMVSGGASIHIDAADLGILIKNARFLAPESPQGTSPTVLSEITRLLEDICPVVALDTVVDASVSKRVIYPQERINAVEDLCRNIGCEYRMNGDGQFEIYPVDPATPVWQIRGGAEGALVRVDRGQNIEGLYNEFVADGQGSKQQPIRGLARIESGPLAWNGEHGVYPTFYSSTLLTTQAQCNAYAVRMRDTMLAGLTQDLTVTCLPHPGIQQGDWVTVASPVVNGQTVTLSGKVKVMSLASANGNSTAAMTLVVECLYSDVQQALGAVNRGA